MPVHVAQFVNTMVAQYFYIKQKILMDFLLHVMMVRPVLKLDQVNLVEQSVVVFSHAFRHNSNRLKLVKKNILLFAVCVLVFTCNKEPEDRYASVYGVYDSSLVGVISIDGKPVNDLYHDSYEIISFDPDNLFQGYATDLAVIENNLYFVSHHKVIVKYNLKENSILDSVSFEGRGPGEYQIINQLFSDGSSLFVKDMLSQRLIQYDSDLKYINEFILDDLELMYGSKSDIKNGRIIYPLSSNEKYLARVLNLNNPNEAVLFFNRIVALGKQPQQYNRFISYINPNEKKLITSSQMPLIFLFDTEFKVEKILRLKGNDVDALQADSQSNSTIGLDDRDVLLNPPPIAIETNRTIRVDAYASVDAIYQDNRIFLYFSNRYSEQRYLIVLEELAGIWTHKGSFRLKKNDESLFTVFYMKYSAPWLYFGSQFEDTVIRVHEREFGF